MKKALLWTGIVIFALMTVVLIANGVFVWRTDARLEAQLSAIRDAGDPVTLADLAPPPVAPTRNAATYLREAEADLAAIEKETKDIPFASQCAGFVLSAKDQKVVKASLAAHSNVMRLLEQAAACPEYDTQLDYTLTPDEFQKSLVDVTLKIRAVARVLHHRADLLVAEGNHDEAVRTAVLLLRLDRHFDGNPTVVGYLAALVVRGMAVQSANEALQTGHVSQDVRNALDAELADHERMDGYASMLRSERAFGLDKTNTLPNRDSWLVQRGMLNLGTSVYLDEIATFLTLTRGDCPSYREAEGTIHRTRRADASFAGDAFAKKVCLGIQTTHLAVTSMRAQIRALRVLNAIQARVPANRKAPPRLDELGLSAETIADPFTGEPLHVKKSPQGWSVYSVGANFKDDGGKMDDLSDIGVGPSPSERPAIKK
jgi:hypothetical protein